MTARGASRARTTPACETRAAPDGFGLMGHRAINATGRQIISTRYCAHIGSPPFSSMLEYPSVSIAASRHLAFAVRRRVYFLIAQRAPALWRVAHRQNQGYGCRRACATWGRYGARSEGESFFRDDKSAAKGGNRRGESDLSSPRPTTPAHSPAHRPMLWRKSNPRATRARFTTKRRTADL